MTKIVESITVEVRCSHESVSHGGGAFHRCPTTANATIVSTVERGDLVLVPVDWSTTVQHGQIAVFCPDHNKKETTQ
jgi:hypothetical protein